jgi:predicted nucleic acid-binding protein
MDATFVDTGYLLALVNTTDKYHPQARATASVIAPPFITTEAVLI